jgi:hypothetical protein
MLAIVSEDFPDLVLLTQGKARGIHKAEACILILQLNL